MEINLALHSLLTLSIPAGMIIAWQSRTELAHGSKFFQFTHKLAFALMFFFAVFTRTNWWVSTLATLALLTITLLLTHAALTVLLLITAPIFLSLVSAEYFITIAGFMLSFGVLTGTLAYPSMKKLCTYTLLYFFSGALTIFLF